MPYRTLVASIFLSLAVIPAPAFGRAEGGLAMRKIYYDSGAVKAEFLVRGGKLHGPTRWYYESGALGAVLNYRENRLNGPLMTYYENGSVKRVARIVDNRPDGEVRSYHRNGRLQTVDFMAQGDPLTRWVLDEQGHFLRCEEPSVEGTGTR